MAPERVLIIGAGAAGMSCADQLAQSPDKFHVTLLDSVSYCGGQAFSIPIDAGRHGASWLNQGVQGGSYIFRHTFHMFHKQGFNVFPVKLQVSFGKDDKFWSNMFPTTLVEKHEKEIKRFNLVLKLVRTLEALFVFVPVWLLMRVLLFSREFTDHMIMPTLALFLGTGNATPSVSSVILERLFTSPTYGMWYDESKSNTAFASNSPPMVVFPNFTEFYTTWQKSLEKAGVEVRLNTECTGVLHRCSKGVKVAIKKRTPSKDGHNHASGVTPAHEPSPDSSHEETIEEYDELVFACLADSAKKLLANGKTISLRERFVLGNTKWSDDITVTHTDSAYMEKHYTNSYTDAQSQTIATFAGEPQTQKLEVGREFSPMYYIRAYPQDPRRLEMSFDVSNYQFQFPKKQNSQSTDDEVTVSTVPFKDHIFQTIFLNKDRDIKLWAKDEIDKSKIIREDWWHQLCHNWTHYAFVIPFLSFLNARRSKSTRFAGSWTLVNAHEIACISGLAAAWSLGGGYPEELEGGPEEDVEDERWRGFGLLCFRLYCLIAYRRWYRKGS